MKSVSPTYSLKIVRPNIEGLGRAQDATRLGREGQEGGLGEHKTCCGLLLACWIWTDASSPEVQWRQTSIHLLGLKRATIIHYLYDAQGDSQALEGPNNSAYSIFCRS